MKYNGTEMQNYFIIVLMSTMDGLINLEKEGVVCKVCVITLMIFHHKQICYNNMQGHHHYDDPWIIGVCVSTCNMTIYDGLP